jgi:phytoene synthase
VANPTASSFSVYTRQLKRQLARHIVWSVVAMAIETVASWEVPLLARAYQAWHDRPEPTRAITDDAALARAYAHCAKLTLSRSSTFHLASALLPPAKRRAMRALYAFCRVTDDIVDKPTDDKGGVLAAWRQRVVDPRPSPDDAVALAWADTRSRYHIPPGYAQQLIEGVACDLRPERYASFTELAGYAYAVAATVGLMSMHIVGFADEAAIPYAVRLGIALQLTNILRDVGEDRSAGRLYLPLDELAAFGLGEADIAVGRVDDRWRAFMRFQIHRTRALYLEAWPGMRLLSSDGRPAVAAAAVLYRAILDDIEAHDFDVFHRRAHVGTWSKLRRLPGIWWRNR